MRFPPALALAVLLAAPLPLSAALDASLAHARAAQARLGRDTWSRVLRIENDNRKSAYPKTLYVLVFELASILWFYSDVDGTQSLSLYRDHVAQDQGDLGPLLRAIDPGFRRWTEVADPADSAERGEVDVPNGCFIDSVAAWRRVADRDSGAAEPRLLSFYGDPALHLAGHTVLTFVTAQELVVVDPMAPRQRQVYPLELRRDALALARAVAGPVVVKARFLPMPDARAVKRIAQVGPERRQNPG